MPRLDNLRPIRLRRCLPAAFGTLLSGTAKACTVCDSEGGHALRAGLFNGHFLGTLLLVAAPIPILAAAVCLLHCSVPDLQTPDRTSSFLTVADAEVPA